MVTNDYGLDHSHPFPTFSTSKIEMEVSIVMGVPKHEWFILENPSIN